MNLARNILQEHDQLIKEAVSSCLLELESYIVPEFLIAYGSLVLGTMTSLSDIDLLFVVNNQHRPERKGLVVKSRPVTLYIISYESLINDAQDFLYGGYFAGKLLNPHSILYDRTGSSEDNIDYALKVFLNTIFSRQIESVTIPNDSLESFTKLVFKEYMEIHPHYSSYIMKIFKHHRFPEIWSNIQDRFKPAYLSIKNKQILAGEERKQSPNQIRQSNVEIAMRFWKTGIELHNNDISFPELYFTKCNQQIASSQHDFRSFLEFIN